MNAPIAISDEDIDRMTDEACDAIAAIVQKSIGQTDGGIAGQEFGRHGKPWTTVRCVVVDYLAAEEGTQS